MKHRMIVALALVLALMMAAVLPAAPAMAGPLPQDATPTPAPEEESAAEESEEAMEEAEEDLELVTATASADLVRPGRVLMSARSNHWVYDSVPPLDGPNEEVNPLDALIGALPACGVMVYEAVARENEIALDAVNATVEADFDPRGVAGANVDPRVRAFRVTMNVDGPTMEEAAMMAEQFTRRCPIYTTLIRSAPIEVTNVLIGSDTTVTDAESEQSADANVAPTVTFTAANNAYKGPDTIPGGLTRIEFVNSDDKDHTLWLVKRDEGKTFDDVLGIFMALGSDAPDFPEWAVWHGGVAAGPGETHAYTIDLAPGDYTIYSFSADADGVPEMFTGMSVDLTVTEAEETGATPPAADLRAEMADYSYAMEGAPAAGPVIVELTNTGTEPHEAYMYKLDEGVSVQDAMDFMTAGEDADGPEPFTAVDALAPMSSGLTAWYELELESGDYGVFCFIPDTVNVGMRHHELGMIAQFTVE